MKGKMPFFLLHSGSEGRSFSSAEKERKKKEISPLHKKRKEREPSSNKIKGNGCSFPKRFLPLERCRVPFAERASTQIFLFPPFHLSDNGCRLWRKRRIETSRRSRDFFSPQRLIRPEDSLARVLKGRVRFFFPLPPLRHGKQGIRKRRAFSFFPPLSRSRKNEFPKVFFFSFFFSDAETVTTTWLMGQPDRRCRSRVEQALPFLFFFFFPPFLP